MITKKKTPVEWGRRTTRIEPPVLDEAITAAQGLTDQIDSQIEIAAQLMGMSEDKVRPAVLKAAAPAPRARQLAAPARNLGTKVVVVERRRPRAMSK